MMKSATSPVSSIAFLPSMPQTFNPIPSVEPRSGELGVVSLENRIQAGSDCLANTPIFNSAGRLGSISSVPCTTPCILRNTARSAGRWPSVSLLAWTMPTNISSSRRVGSPAQSKHGGTPGFVSVKSLLLGQVY